MQDFAGKTVLITGGGGAIGSATARIFHERGANLALVDLNGAALEAVRSDLGSDRVTTFAGDVSDPDIIEHAIAGTVSRFGSLDVVFSNAGISGEVHSFETFPLDEWDHIVRINLRSMFITVKAAAREMVRAGKGGAIVTMSSSMGGWDVLAGGAGYGATKYAVTGLTKTAAFDLAKYGIRVNAVCPGVTETTLGVPGMREGADQAQSAVQQFAKRIPLKRIGQVDDVGEVVAFLASDAARHVNGAAWLIDGGQTLQSFANGPESGEY